MAALKPRPAFQVLVMAEEFRLGRERIEVASALKQLAQAGVRVWLYLEDRERTLDSTTDKLLMSVTAFADELEREIASDEAAVVRKIFELCAAGVGMHRIAIVLNDESAPAPTPRRAGRPRSWAPSTVREILYRDLYRGVVVRNRKHCSPPSGSAKRSASDVRGH